MNINKKSAVALLVLTTLLAAPALASAQEQEQKKGKKAWEIGAGVAGLSSSPMANTASSLKTNIFTADLISTLPENSLHGSIWMFRAHSASQSTGLIAGTKRDIQFSSAPAFS